MRECGTAEVDSVRVLRFDHGLSEVDSVRVFGFDPGLAETGWGVIDWVPARRRAELVAYGVIKTAPEDPIQDRVEFFADRVCAITREHGGLIREHGGLFNRPTFASAESYQNYGRVFWNGVQTLYVLGALITLIAERLGPLHLIGAAHAKHAIGVFDGDKKTVRARVTALLKLPKPPKTSHESDALCVALARLKSLELEQPGLVDGATEWLKGVA